LAMPSPAAIWTPRVSAQCRDGGKIVSNVAAGS
jgi:hypothetical protein